MKCNINKNIKTSILVTPNLLQEINTELSKICENIRYKILTSDGIEYKTDCLSEIIEFENRNDSKIEQISFITTKKYKVFIILNFINDQIGIVTSSLHMYDVTQNEKVLISDAVMTILSRHKTSYSYLYNTWIERCVRWTLLICLCILSQRYILPLIKNDTSTSFILIMIINFVLGGVFSYAYLKTRQWQFPKLFFYLGKQKHAFDNLKKWRNKILSAMGTIILSIIGTAIYSLIFD